MITALGGPPGLVDSPGAHLRAAAVTRPAQPSRSGYVQSIDTRAMGLAVVALGGGRRQVGEDIDHSVGLSEVVAVGGEVDRDRPLAIVHARNDSDAALAAEAVR